MDASRTKPWNPASSCAEQKEPSDFRRQDAQVTTQKQDYGHRSKHAVPWLQEDRIWVATFFLMLSLSIISANGAVVRATKRNNSKQRLAIKRCFIDDSDTPHLAYILRELRIMGCLNHENLIALREATLWGDYVWMAMDLMRCSVFGLLCKISTGLPEELAVYVLKQCLNGIIYLHGKGYMHRDIKCENLLLGSDGEVKLADFGLASPTNRMNNMRLGTAKWMAPEVIREQPYTESVDIWSLGITTIEMMDRVPPLYYLEQTDDIFAEILWGARQPFFTFSTPSEAMAAIVRWMLNTDGSRRPSAALVLE
ncbi:kinase-like domain-containing protein, partial [Jimgerdemannia flammicorona]